jgi:hypothetical protein
MQYLHGGVSIKSPDSSFFLHSAFADREKYCYCIYCTPLCFEPAQHQSIAESIADGVQSIAADATAGGVWWDSGCGAIDCGDRVQ